MENFLKKKEKKKFLFYNLFFSNYKTKLYIELILIIIIIVLSYF